MTHIVPRRTAVILWMLASLFASSACLTLGSGAALNTPAPRSTAAALPATPAAAATSSGPAQTAAPQATDDPGVVATEGPEVTAHGKLVLGPGAFKYPEPTTGLADLASYKATLRLLFIGTQAGQPSQWSKTYVMLSTLKPLARQVTVESTGPAPEAEPLFMAEMNGAAYERRGQAPCGAAELVPEEKLTEQMEPAGFLTGVLGAQAAGSETLNGVAANHYTFDERAVLQSGLAQSVGELWVAAEGGYVVKYVLATHAGADYFGVDTEGTLTWDYQLTDINQPVAIQLPADCPAGMLDAPLPPDASGAQKTLGQLSFTTNSSPADVAAFYQASLPALGWQPVGEPAIAEILALLHFTRAEQKLTVIVTKNESGTQAQLILGPITPQ